MYQILEKFIKDKTEIDKEMLAKICANFTLIKTKRNEIILDYNEVSKHYYFINKGCIRLFTISKSGDENSRYFAFEGNFVTALPSFIDQMPAEEYLQTIEKSEYEVATYPWSYAVDLDWQPEEETKPLKLTMEQIAEKFNAEKIEIVNYGNKQ